MVMQYGGSEAIGETRRKLLERGVGALQALAGGDAGIRAGREQRVDELRQVGGVVLAVAIERDDDTPVGGKHAAAHGRTLAGRAIVAEHAQAAAAVCDAGAELFRRAVGRPVVDDDHLVVAPVQRGLDLVEKQRQIVSFVPAGDDHRHLFFGLQPVQCEFSR